MNNSPQADALLISLSLAERLGLSEAVLYALYQSCLGRYASEPVISLTPVQWRGLAPFWDEEQLAIATQGLVSAGLIEAKVQHGHIEVVLLEKVNSEGLEANDAVSEPVAQVPTTMVQTAPPMSASSAGARPLQALAASLKQPQDSSTTIPTEVPAPNFGGSVGWPRRAQEQPRDELEALFSRREQQHQQMFSLELNWRPSENAVRMLEQHHRIPQAFAEQCLDEFIAYWSDPAKRKSAGAWDQSFMKWVKRDWVQHQAQQNAGRQQSVNQEEAGSHAEGRQRARESREQVRRFLYDVHNLDW